MKKIFLFALATALAVVASAQTKSEMAKNAPAMPVQIASEHVVGTETLHRLTADEAKAQFKVAPKANVKAWYNRPAGTMWQTYITTDAKGYYQACMAPYLHVNPWKSVTFESAATDATSQEWTFFHRKKRETYTDPSVTTQWGCQTDTIPVLTARDNRGNSSVYTPESYNKDASSKYASYINAYTNYVNQYRPGNAQHFWSSPKFFAAESNRDGTKTSGSFTAGVTDNYGRNAGQLMGKNTVNLNGMAIAAEAPEHPYIINRVGLLYQCLKLAEGVNVPMTATIYKLESVPAYIGDGTPVMMDEPTEVLATVTINVNTAWLGSQREQYKTAEGYHGILPFTLKQPLEVNSAILVCVEGYNVPEMNDAFSSVYSSDYYDEGHGEIAYIKTTTNGKPIFVGLRGGFISPTRYTAPAVLLDEERRFIEFNKSDETGIWNVPVEGGDHNIDIFSYLPSAQVNIKVTELDQNGAVVNDGAAPAWLTVSLTDQTDPWGNPIASGIVFLDAKAEANPGQKRAAQVELSFLGAKLVYHVTQDGTTPSLEGDVNGDGTVDISDVNILINIALGKAEAEQYPNADITGDGTVDISDVNADINLILEK